MSKKGALSVKTNITLIIVVLIAIVLLLLYSFISYNVRKNQQGGSTTEPLPTEPSTIPGENTNPLPNEPTPEPNTNGSTNSGSSGGGSSSSSSGGSSPQPSLTITDPDDGSTYGDQGNIPLRFRIQHFTPQACWYNIDGGDSVAVSGCRNTTFDIDQGNHTIHVFANNSAGSEVDSSSDFSVVPGVPQIVLNSPDNNFYSNNTQDIIFSYTPTHRSLFTCSLYGNFNGTFRRLMTDEAPQNGQENTFQLSNNAAGSYKWAIWCNTTDGLTARSGNRTFTVDLTQPNLTIIQPVGSSASISSVPLRVRVIENNLQICLYKVTYLNLTTVVPVTPMPNCTTTSFSVPSYGSYRIYVTAYDLAGNAKGTSGTFTVSSSAPDTSLLAYYPFNQVVNGITPDNSTYHRNALTHGTQMIQGFVHAAQNVLRFSQGDYVVPNSQADVDVGSSFTLASWMKMDNYPSEVNESMLRILYKGRSGLDYVSYSLFIDNANKLNARFFYANDNNSGVLVTSPNALSKGRWYHVAAILRGNNLELYVNNTLVSQVSTDGHVPYNNDDPLLIGAQNGTLGVQNSFVGSLDDVVLYNRALSGDELDMLYSGTGLQLSPSSSSVSFFTPTTLTLLVILVIILLVLLIMLWLAMKKNNKKPITPQGYPGYRPPFPPMPPQNRMPMQRPVVTGGQGPNFGR